MSLVIPMTKTAITIIHPEMPSVGVPIFGTCKMLSKSTMPINVTSQAVIFAIILYLLSMSFYVKKVENADENKVECYCDI